MKKKAISGNDLHFNWKTPLLRETKKVIHESMSTAHLNVKKVARLIFSTHFLDASVKIFICMNWGKNCW